MADVVKSNDNLEVLWMKKVLLGIIEKETVFYELLDDCIKEKISYEIYKQKMKEKIDSFFDKKELKSKFFVMCFSGEKSEDRLSQWRGYGDDGKGIAIAFDERILEKTSRRISYRDENSKIEFKKVEYDLEEKKNIIREFWKEQICIANKQINTVEVDFELWMIESFSKLYEKAIFMKNPFFEEEDESRVVFEKDNMESQIIGESLRNKIVVHGV